MTTSTRQSFQVLVTELIKAAPYSDSSWGATACTYYRLRRFMPTNVVLYAISTLAVASSGGVPAMLLAVPYTVAAALRRPLRRR